MSRSIHPGKEPDIAIEKLERARKLVPGEPASRHYQRARQDRGSETRENLIIAALDAFGRFGFEGASTRDIAKRAGANLAAIVYHFGSKEALLHAVAEHVVEKLQKGAGKIASDTEAMLTQGSIGKPEARRLLQNLVEGHIATMLGERDAELWARFIMREQMEPSSAFDTIYSFMAQTHLTSKRIIAILLDIDPASDEASLRMFALMGQVIMFRVAQPLVLRTLGRDTLKDTDRAWITQIATENIDRIVGFPLHEAVAK